MCTQLEGSTFAWDTTCQGAFEGIKHAISDKLFLALYDPNATTFLTTDASRVGISAVLTQIQGAKKFWWLALAILCNQWKETTALSNRKLLPAFGG